MGEASSVAPLLPALTLEGVTRIPFHGLVLVGLGWLNDHRLLITTPSQIIVWDIHEGSRIKEWNVGILTSKTPAFSLPAVLENRSMYGVQGPSCLLSWNEQDTDFKRARKVSVPFMVGGLCARGHAIFLVSHDGQSVAGFNAELKLQTLLGPDKSAPSIASANNLPKALLWSSIINKSLVVARHALDLPSKVEVDVYSTEDSGGLHKTQTCTVLGPGPSWGAVQSCVCQALNDGRGLMLVSCWEGASPVSGIDGNCGKTIVCATRFAGDLDQGMLSSKGIRVYSREIRLPSPGGDHGRPAKKMRSNKVTSPIDKTNSTTRTSMTVRPSLCCTEEALVIHYGPILAVWDVAFGTVLKEGVYHPLVNANPGGGAVMVSQDGNGVASVAGSEVILWHDLLPHSSLGAGDKPPPAGSLAWAIWTQSKAMAGGGRRSDGVDIELSSHNHPYETGEESAALKDVDQALEGKDRGQLVSVLDRHSWEVESGKEATLKLSTNNDSRQKQARPRRATYPSVIEKLAAANVVRGDLNIGPMVAGLVDPYRVSVRAMPTLLESLVASHQMDLVEDILVKSDDIPERALVRAILRIIELDQTTLYHALCRSRREARDFLKSLPCPNGGQEHSLHGVEQRRNSGIVGIKRRKDSESFDGAAQKMGETFPPSLGSDNFEMELTNVEEGAAAYIRYMFEIVVRRPVCAAFLSTAMADLSESQVIVFLTALKGLWMMTSSSARSVWPWRKTLDEGWVLDWLMALLDSNSVRLMLLQSSGHHRLWKVLRSMNGLTRQELRTWETWECLKGCLDQLSKKDYKIETAAPYTQDFLLV